MNVFGYILIFCVLCVSQVWGRKVAALDDICARGAYAFCPNAGSRQSQSKQENARRDLPQATQSLQHNALDGTPPPLPTVGEYCAKYQEHYIYYCSGDKAKDAKANDFCPTYLSHCDVQPQAAPEPATVPPQLPPEKIQKVCVEYQSIANQYCFRPEIPKGWGVKKNCDLYLKNCVGTTGDQLKSRTMEQALRDNIRPCEKYYNDYIGFCAQNPTPYNQNTAEFCKNYKATCVPVNLLTPESLGASQAASMAQVQPQPQVGQPVQMVPQQRPLGISGQNGAIGGNPFSAAGSPMSPFGAPQLGNPNTISDPIGSLGGNPQTVSNPLGSLGGGTGMGNPASQMINNMQGAPQAVAPVDAQGNAPSGLAAHPLAFGQQTAVGQMAGVSSGTAVNPFGQVATGRAVNAGPVGVQSGSALDFSGIPGLSQLGSLPGLGKRRRKRGLSMLMWLL